MLRRVMVISMAVLFGSAAWGQGAITGLSASPGSVPAGGSVDFTVDHAGAACGFALRTDAGPLTPPRGVRGAAKTVSVSFPLPGSYAVSVVGRRKDAKPRCEIAAGVQASQVVVSATGPGAGGGRITAFAVEPAQAASSEEFEVVLEHAGEPCGFLVRAQQDGPPYRKHIIVDASVLSEPTARFPFVPILLSSFAPYHAQVRGVPIGEHPACTGSRSAIFTVANADAGPSDRPSGVRERISPDALQP